MKDPFTLFADNLAAGYNIQQAAQLAIMNKYKATLEPIGHGHESPPVAFLDTILKWAQSESDTVFERNTGFDIYSVLEKLPHTSLLERKAVALEALRCIGGFESNWNWKEGRDVSAGPETEEQMEAGAFQVSFDSSRLGPDLQRYLIENGIFHAGDFRTRIQVDPVFDCAYTFRLLRVSTRWDGPINRGWVTAAASLDAHKEWMALL